MRVGKNLKTLWTAVPLASALIMACGSAWAQAYPSKPVKVVVPWNAGSSVDAVTRFVSTYMGNKLGGSFVVENKAGATGAIGADSVSASPADGYTLLTIANVYIMAKALQKQPFDFKNEWTSIGMMASPATILEINPKIIPGVKDFAGFVAFTKANPNVAINYGSSGTGSSTHLSMLMLSKRLGLNATHIPYKGMIPAIADLVGGRLSAMIADYGSSKVHVASGSLVPLMVVMPNRLADLPNVPVAREVGMQELESMVVTFGLVAPKGTPTAVATRLTGLVRDAVADREVQDAIRKSGNEPQFMDAAPYGATLDDVYGKFIKLVQENNIKPD